MTKPGLLRRLASEARPFWRQILGVLAISLLATPLILLTPIPIKVAVDSVLGSQPLPGWLDPLVPAFAENSDTGLLVVIALLQVLIVLLVQLQELGQYVASTTTAQRMTLAFRYRLFRRSQRLSLAFHDSRGTMDSIYRIQWDAPALQYVTIEGLVPLISALVMLGAMFIGDRQDRLGARPGRSCGVAAPLLLRQRVQPAHETALRHSCRPREHCARRGAGGAELVPRREGIRPRATRGGALRPPLRRERESADPACLRGGCLRRPREPDDRGRHRRGALHRHSARAVGNDHARPAARRHRLPHAAVHAAAEPQPAGRSAADVAGQRGARVRAARRRAGCPRARRRAGPRASSGRDRAART